MTPFDWVDEASKESFPASDAPAWPDLPPPIACPPQRSDAARAIAFHEAGHAVVGLRQGLDVLGADILPDLAGGRGHTRFAHPGSWFQPEAGRVTEREREVVDRVLVTFLAGFAAEQRLGGADQSASGFDVDAAIRDWISLLAATSAERQAALDDYSDRAATAVGEPHAWRAIEALAQRLLEEGRLDGAEVRRAVEA